MSLLVGPARAGRRTAAVVLNYETPDDTVVTTRALLASRPPLDEIAVVDNGPPGGACERAVARLNGRVSCLATGCNLGFSGGMNAGIRAALDRGATHVLLVNSDVIVPPDGVTELLGALDIVPEAGLAAPVVLSRARPDRVTSLGMRYEPATGRMRHRGFMRSAGDLPGDGTEVVDGASGCALLIAAEVFDAVGLLDESYFFGFEDLDFCLRARRAGYLTVLAYRARVRHEGGGSMAAGSTRRLYFAARNHLRLAARHGTGDGRLAAAGRQACVVGWNLAHAVRAGGWRVPARMAAVVRGTADYARGRFGSDRADERRG